MPEFTNEVIAIDALPKYEQVKLNAPDPRYWKVIMINIGCIMGLSLVIFAFFLFIQEDIRRYSIWIAGGIFLFFLIIFFLYRLSFKKRGYALREKDILYKSGLIAEKTTIVPLNRIQHVALDEGLFSRIFGLATLQIHTAGGGTGHLHIAGVPVEQAKAIKEALLKRIELSETALHS